MNGRSIEGKLSGFAANPVSPKKFFHEQISLSEQSSQNQETEIRNPHSGTKSFLACCFCLPLCRLWLSPLPQKADQIVALINYRDCTDAVALH